MSTLEREIMSAAIATGADDQARLVRALTDPTLYGAGCTAIRVIETTSR